MAQNAAANSRGIAVGRLDGDEGSEDGGSRRRFSSSEVCARGGISGERSEGADKGSEADKWNQRAEVRSRRGSAEGERRRAASATQAMTHTLGTGP